jgi:hypothetical protein
VVHRRAGRTAHGPLRAQLVGVAQASTRRRAVEEFMHIRSLFILLTLLAGSARATDVTLLGGVSGTSQPTSSFQLKNVVPFRGGFNLGGDVIWRDSPSAIGMGVRVDLAYACPTGTCCTPSHALDDRLDMQVLYEIVVGSGLAPVAGVGLDFGLQQNGNGAVVGFAPTLGLAGVLGLRWQVVGPLTLEAVFRGVGVLPIVATLPANADVGLWLRAGVTF